MDQAQIDNIIKLAAHWLVEGEKKLAKRVMETPGAIAAASPAGRKDVYRAMDQSAKIAPGSTNVKMKVGAELGRLGQGIVHGVELAGLGTLAHDSYKDLKDPSTSDKHRSKAKKELAGLGILSLPAVHHLGSEAIGALRKFKHGSVDLEKLAKWLDPTMASHAISDAWKARGAAQTAKAALPKGAMSLPKVKGTLLNEAPVVKGKMLPSQQQMPVVQGRLL